MITVERFIAWRRSVVPRPLLQFHLDYPPPYSPDQPRSQANRPQWPACRSYLVRSNSKPKTFEKGPKRLKGKSAYGRSSKKKRRDMPRRTRGSASLVYLTLLGQK